ncbi:PhnA domain-containing protein [Algivirga pacifica]|uniref:Alkylphosphonate utilization protein n=1 Tax=Algivirga pacifica TaxID=1162670 RepID=A0ABP9DB25_9BACT
MSNPSKLEHELLDRGNYVCELCGADTDLQIYHVPPVIENDAEQALMICPTCHDQIEEKEEMDANHWRCLNDSIWSAVPGIQIVSYRMLHRLRKEGWPQDLLDQVYMEEDLMARAQETLEEDPVDGAFALIHKDSNGNVLEAGDTVTLIKDLNVKGANFTAKRGTAVRNISLVHDNPEHIEGKVNGQQIVILTKYVKK